MTRGFELTRNNFDMQSAKEES